MSYRFNAFVVMFEKDIDEDYAKALTEAIKCMRGVLTVEPHESDINSATAQARANIEVRKRLMDVMRSFG